MIRGQGRGRGEFPRVHRIDEIQDFPVDQRAQDDTVPGAVGVSGRPRQQASDHACEGGQALLRQGKGSGGLSAHRFPGVFFHVLFGPGGQGDGGFIRFPGGIAPGEQPVPHQDNRAGPGIPLQFRGYRLGKGEPGVGVREDGNSVAQRGAQVFFPLRLVRERQDGIGVGVVDEFAGDECVDEGFDGRGGRPGVQAMGAEGIDHVPVRQVVQGPESFHVVQLQPGIAVRFDGGHVVTRGLDEQGPDGFSQEVGPDRFHGGVAAAMQHQAGFRTDQGGHVEADGQVLAIFLAMLFDELRGLVVRPAVDHAILVSLPLSPTLPPGCAGLPPAPATRAGFSDPGTVRKPPGAWRFRGPLFSPPGSWRRGLPTGRYSSPCRRPRPPR